MPVSTFHKYVGKVLVQLRQHDGIILELDKYYDIMLKVMLVIKDQLCLSGPTLNRTYPHKYMHRLGP